MSAAGSPQVNEGAFTPSGSAAPVRAVELAPKSGQAGFPVRITLRLPRNNDIAAFRVIFGAREANSQLASEEILSDYERIVLVSPAPEQAALSVNVVVQGMAQQGHLLEEWDAGQFTYSNLAQRGTKRPGDPLEGMRQPLSLSQSQHGSPAYDHARSPAPTPGPMAAMPSPLPPPQAGAHNDAMPFNGVPQNVRAVLRFTADLNSVTRGWSHEEFAAKRRLVQFWRQQEGNVINATFRPIDAEDYVPDSIVVSCIYRDDNDECFITSVDTIYLLEALVGVRFTVEEKNRVRRNLEGYKPVTISKTKAESEAFFKVIMGFGQPRPRNIEKDVKVFPWRVLASALKKIISKYSAQYSRPDDPLPQIGNEAAVVGTRLPQHVSQGFRTATPSPPVTLAPLPPPPSTASAPAPAAFTFGPYPGPSSGPSSLMMFDAPTPRYPTHNTTTQ